MPGELMQVFGCEALRFELGDVLRRDTNGAHAGEIVRRPASMPSASMDLT